MYNCEKNINAASSLLHFNSKFKSRISLFASSINALAINRVHPKISLEKPEWKIMWFGFHEKSTNFVHQIFRQIFLANFYQFSIKNFDLKNLKKCCNKSKNSIGIHGNWSSWNFEFCLDLWKLATVSEFHVSGRSEDVENIVCKYKLEIISWILDLLVSMV